MTIVVSVMVNDGIVLAADSASSLIRDNGSVARVYNNGNKLFNLVKGCPIGAMTYGSGAIGKASIATLSKDLRAKLSDANDRTYHLEKGAYTIEDVAKRARRFLFEECYRTQYPDGHPQFHMGYRIGGFSRPGDSAELWEFVISNRDCEEPKLICGEGHYGPRWAGQTEAIDRIVLGMGSGFVPSLVQLGVPEADAISLRGDLVPLLYVQLAHPAMPIQDAIELARFLASTAARFAEFQEDAATVGGPIEIASITKHEGYKWVARKHYYSQEFNVGATDHVS